MAFLVAGIFAHPVRSIALSVFRLPLVLLTRVTSTLAWLPQLPSLAADNAALRSELAARQLELVKLREIVRHLTQAEQLRQPIKGTPVSIIGRTLMPTEQTILVDKGAKDGLVPDGFLVNADGFVGRILEVYPMTSLAVLVTDVNSRIACLVERSRESGLLVGTGERLAQLIYVDLDGDVAVSDRLGTAGLEGALPKGILVGTVIRVVKDERKASLKAWVRPVVRLGQVEEVLYLPPAS